MLSLSMLYVVCCYVVCYGVYTRNSCELSVSLSLRPVFSTWLRFYHSNDVLSAALTPNKDSPLLGALIAVASDICIVLPILISSSQYMIVCSCNGPFLCSDEMRAWAILFVGSECHLHWASWGRPVPWQTRRVCFGLVAWYHACKVGGADWPHLPTSIVVCHGLGGWPESAVPLCGRPYQQR